VGICSTRTRVHIQVLETKKKKKKTKRKERERKSRGKINNWTVNVYHDERHCTVLVLENGGQGGEREYREEGRLTSLFAKSTIVCSVCPLLYKGWEAERKVRNKKQKKD
jgi:hypothetical protein